MKVGQLFYSYCSVSYANFIMLTENHWRTIRRFINSLYAEMYNIMKKQRNIYRVEGKYRRFEMSLWIWNSVNTLNIAWSYWGLTKFLDCFRHSSYFSEPSSANGQEKCMNNHGLNDPETQMCQHWDTEHSPRLMTQRGRQWCSLRKITFKPSNVSLPNLKTKIKKLNTKKIKQKHPQPGEWYSD